MTDNRMGYPAIATWIAEEYPSDRKPQRTPVRVRLSEDVQSARRILDVPPKRAAQIDEEEDAPPQADADGWIAWGGGECPIPGKRFDVRLRNGSEYYWCEHMETASDLRWSKEGYEGDIIAYRIVEEAKESDEIKAGDLVEVIGEPQGSFHNGRIGIAESCERRPGHAHPVFRVDGRVYYVKNLRKIDPHSEPLRLGDVIDVNRLSRIVITQFSLDWWNMAENRRRVRLVRRDPI